jgi:hypothetical protein
MLVTAGEKVSAYHHRANLARMRAVVCVAAVFVQWLFQGGHKQADHFRQHTHAEQVSSIMQ